jgi:hypothetical protein
LLAFRLSRHRGKGGWGVVWVSAAKEVGGVWEAKETMRGAGALDKAVPCCSALLGVLTCEGSGST